jgi:hypothetical protein
LFDTLFIHLIKFGDQRRRLTNRSPQRFIKGPERVEFPASELVAYLYRNSRPVRPASGFPPVSTGRRGCGCVKMGGVFFCDAVDSGFGHSTRQ